MSIVNIRPFAKPSIAANDVLHPASLPRFSGDVVFARKSIHIGETYPAAAWFEMNSINNTISASAGEVSPHTAIAHARKRIWSRWIRPSLITSGLRYCAVPELFAEITCGRKYARYTTIGHVPTITSPPPKRWINAGIMVWCEIRAFVLT